jgi:hypothetical protein
VHAVAVCTPVDADAGTVQRRVARLTDPTGRWSGPLDELMRKLSEREADPVRTLASARADVAALLGVPEARVELVCEPGPVTRRPPRVLLDGCPARADVSLSHDGDWIAWAIWVDR